MCVCVCVYECEVVMLSPLSCFYLFMDEITNTHIHTYTHTHTHTHTHSPALKFGGPVPLDEEEGGEVGLANDDGML